MLVCELCGITKDEEKSEPECCIALNGKHRFFNTNTRYSHADPDNKK